MTNLVYHAVVYLLRLCADPAQRCRAWRALDGLQLSDEERAEVERRLDVEDRTDEARTFQAWSICTALIPAPRPTSARPGLRLIRSEGGPR